MNPDAHAEFLQDPEAHASHLNECAECRAIVETLQAPLTHEPIAVDKLPVAPWEGAAYRSWGFVTAATIILGLVAYVLCRWAGLSPLHAVSADAEFTQWRTLFVVLGRALRPWQIISLFVGVNGLLIFLLRKAPKGIDA